MDLTAISVLIALGALGISIWSLLLARRVDRRQRSADHPILGVKVSDRQLDGGWFHVSIDLINRTDAIWELSVVEIAPKTAGKIVSEFLRKPSQPGHIPIKPETDLRATFDRATHRLEYGLKVGPAGSVPTMVSYGDHASGRLFIWVSPETFKSARLLFTLKSHEPGARDVHFKQVITQRSTATEQNNIVTAQRNITSARED